METKVTVQSVVNAKTAELMTVIAKRDAEIARLNTIAPVKGVGRYEPVVAGNQVAVAFIAGIADMKQSAIKARVDAKLIRKVSGAKVDRTVYDALAKQVKDILKTISDAALQNKPKGSGGRTSSGSGSHAITKAWFDKHAATCPKAMKIGWDDVAKKVTYDKPKGGRGATVSFGALNNIVKAYGGKVKA